MNTHRGLGSTYQRGKVWWFQYYRNGKAYRESSNSTKENDARKLLKRKLGEIVLGMFIEPSSEKITLKQITDDLLTDYRVNGKRSLSRMQNSTNHLRTYFIDDKVLSITTDRIRSYISHRQAEGAVNATINRELAALKRSFTLGVQAQKLHTRPYIPTLQENNVRTGFFEYGDFVAVRDRLPDYLKPVVTFLYYTGCRKGEALALEWRQVDMDNCVVRLDPGTTKSGEGRLLFLDGELLQVIQSQSDKRTILCPHIFHSKGKRIGDFRKAWRSACKAVGLAGRIPHDLRRTAIRNMIRAGVPERVAMMISGHKTRSVFDRYNIVNEQDLREAARKTSEHIEHQSKVPSVVPLKTTGTV